MSLKTITTAAAPAAIGPYSQAVVADGLVFCSGQIPLDPATAEVVGCDTASQTRQALKNLEAVLSAAGSSLGQVIKTTVFLQDLGDFAAMNAVYAEAFGGHKPARAAFEVSRLPKDVRVEIEAIAKV